MGIYGLLAGQYGVPVIAASGDDVFIEEHRALFPATRFIQVKQAQGANSGVSLSPEAACAAIRQGVAQAVGQATGTAPLRMAGPIVVDLQTQTVALADLFCQWPMLQRVAGDALHFTAPDVEGAVRMINCLSAMSSMLR
jgi:D-amino peptidase